MFALAPGCPRSLGGCRPSTEPELPGAAKARGRSAARRGHVTRDPGEMPAQADVPKFSAVYHQKQGEGKKSLYSHSHDELGLVWKGHPQQPHRRKQDRQTWRTDKPPDTFGLAVTFGYLSHLEKYIPPEMPRQSRDWLKQQEMSYLLSCFHIFSNVRELPAAAIETTATDNKTLWAI